MKGNKKEKSSFTLIELLVVIAIIGIITGMIFKMMGYASRQALTARTIEVLERTSDALNEFRSEYGIYPPVPRNICEIESECSVCYEYESASWQKLNSPWLYNNYFFQPDQWSIKPILFTYGLVSYLILRDDGNIIHKNNDLWIPDTPRDTNVKIRLSRFLEGIITEAELGDYRTASGNKYKNHYRTIHDSWDNVIHYETQMPYLSYKLWSNGPDEKNGTSDDIHKDRM